MPGCDSPRPPTAVDRMVVETCRRVGRWWAAPGRCFGDTADDLAQDGALAVLEARRRYGRERVDHPAFVQLVVDQTCRKRRRYALSKCRDVRQAESLALGDRGLGGDARWATLEQSLDVRRAFGRLPDDLKRVCEALVERPGVEAAAQLGMARSTLYVRIERLRAAFAAVGIDGQQEPRR